MKVRLVWRLVKDTVVQWTEDQPFQLAAALSYYTLFSLAPLLIVVIAVAGFAFGHDAAQARIAETLQGLVGPESAQAIQSIVQNASRRPETGLLSSGVGIGVLLIGAGGVVGQLQTSLNTMWGVAPKPEGLWGILHQRFISFALILAIGFLLLVSLAVSAFLTGLSQFVGNFFGATALVAHALDFVVSLMFAT